MVSVQFRPFPCFPCFTPLVTDKMRNETSTLVPFLTEPDAHLYLCIEVVRTCFSRGYRTLNRDIINSR